MNGDIAMIYEIGWNTQDLVSLIIIFCFLPLLFCFCFVQLKYKTNNDDKEKSPIKTLSGSKSQTKFVMSIVLIILMLFALSPSIPLIKKYKIIDDYKNGQYLVLNNAVIHYSDYHIIFENESEDILIYTDEIDKLLLDCLKHNTDDSKKYTVLISPTSPDVWYMRSPVILCIEVQQ